jgi:hypothetical protein
MEFSALFFLLTVPPSTRFTFFPFFSFRFSSEEIRFNLLAICKERKLIYEEEFEKLRNIKQSQTGGAGAHPANTTADGDVNHLDPSTSRKRPREQELSDHNDNKSSKRKIDDCHAFALKRTASSDIALAPESSQAADAPDVEGGSGDPEDCSQSMNVDMFQDVTVTIAITPRSEAPTSQVQMLIVYFSC